MKSQFLTLAMCALAATAFAQAPTEPGTPGSYRMTIEQCLDYALGNNYTKQSLKLSEQASADTYDQSKMERLPDLGASLSEGVSNSKVTGSQATGSYGVNAGMVLYQGGAMKSTIEQNRLGMEQSEWYTSQYDNTLTVNILQTFLNILGNEELLKYQMAVAEASAEQVKQGKAQYAAGDMLESDYLLLEAQWANDKNNVSDTKITRDNYLLSLKSLLSMEATDQLEVLFPDTAALMRMAGMPPLASVVERTVSTVPDLKISQYNVDIANQGLKGAKSGYYPTVSLSAGLSTGHTNFSGYGSQLSDRFTQQAGLSVSVPIFSNGRNKSRVTQSQIMLRQAELDQKQMELDVVENVTVEYNDVVSSYNKFLTTDIRQNAYLKSFEAYRAKFNAGAITAVDLLQQQNNYISALNDYIQSKYGFMLKRKVLDVYMGVPITL